MTEIYIGLMSGTSADGVDAVLVDLEAKTPKILAKKHLPYPPALQTELLSLPLKKAIPLSTLGQLDRQLAKVMAAATNGLLEKHPTNPSDVRAIGSHGHTLFHAPNLSPATTIQIGDPNTIASLTGIPTVADFRRKDIANGGQGAPFAPIFHQHFFHQPGQTQIIINLGGIANISLLQENGEVLGFDTGPGNGLLDAWIQKCKNQPYDAHGAWGKTGRCNEALLQHLLTDPYFKRPAPKSTGKEYFNLTWLARYIKDLKINDHDLQCTLTHLTASSITSALQSIVPSKTPLYLAGGGAHNAFLLTLLQKDWPNLETTEKLGIPPDWLEAIGFAWLAQQNIKHHPLNLKSITGARKIACLGGYYPV